MSTLVAWFLVILILIGNFLMMRSAGERERDSRQTWLKNLACSFAVSSEELGHRLLTPTTPPSDPVYAGLLDTFSRWQQRIPLIAAVYTMRKDENGVVHLLVSPAADVNGDGKVDPGNELETASPIWTVCGDYAGQFDDVFDRGKSYCFSDEVPVEKRGRVVAAAVPISGPDNSLDAVLGIEFYADQFFDLIGESKWGYFTNTALALAMIFVAYVAMTLLAIAWEKTDENNADSAKAKRPAESASRARADVLANMSHEIRTPMNAVLGFLDMLADEGAKPLTPEKRAEITQIVRNNARNLLGILDNILDISMDEANRPVVGRSPVSHATLSDESRTGDHVPHPAEPRNPTRERNLSAALAPDAAGSPDRGFETGASPDPGSLKPDETESDGKASGESESGDLSTALRGYRILLVEDVAINQLLISFQLRESGAIVDVAENGQVGIDRIRHEESEGRHYDVILMDMQMPVLDGYEATRRLRRQGYRWPIIALTAHALAGDREKTLECGCDDYATKPIDRAVLIDLISHFVSVTR